MLPLLRDARVRCGGFSKFCINDFYLHKDFVIIERVFVNDNFREMCLINPFPNASLPKVQFGTNRESL